MNKLSFSLTFSVWKLIRPSYQQIVIREGLKKIIHNLWIKVPPPIFHTFVSEDITIPTVTESIILEVPQKAEEVSLKKCFQTHLL